jgi:NTE family protein
MLDLGQGRVGVCLGSGYFGFFAHAGLVAALEELGVRPVAIAGCSAGALTGAFWAGGMDSHSIGSVLTSIRLRDFVDLPRPWEVVRAPGGLFGGHRFERLLERYLPVDTFEECTVPFTASIYDLTLRHHRLIDSGPLAPAVRASCSMPGMFAPARVDGHLCWDGGVVEKIPLGPLATDPDLDTIVISYISGNVSSGPPRTMAAGLRAALHTVIHPADQRNVDLARRAGKQVVVIAPAAPRCGPLRLSLGSQIIDLARRDVLRQLEEQDFGCRELS